MAKPPKKSSNNKSDGMDLWNAVVETVTPIKQTHKKPPVETPKSENPAPKKSKKPTPQIPSPPQRPIKQASTRPPPLSDFDRRTTQKLLRGNVEIEDRIDLHGMTKSDAHMALKGFLARAHQKAMRTVLVITGKGQSAFGNHTLHGRDHVSSPERSGVLRNALTDWLNEDGLRQFVIGFQPAHPKHGGGGAFYVRLRRASSPNRDAP